MYKVVIEKKILSSVLDRFTYIIQFFPSLSLPFTVFSAIQSDSALARLIHCMAKPLIGEAGFILIISKIYTVKKCLKINICIWSFMHIYKNYEIKYTSVINNI